MEYPEKKLFGALLPYENLHGAADLNEATATGILPFSGTSLSSSPKNDQIGTDYSEEAIPERDPAYRLSDGTLYETQTVEHLPAAERFALARYLEQLGMSRARAALVVSI